MARKTILLTRPEPRLSAYADELGGMFEGRIICIKSPLLEIKPLIAAPNIDDVQALLFTSANGVRTYSKLNELKPNVPCFCVGDKTAMEARTHGYEAFSAKGGADELVQLAATVLDQHGGPIQYIRGMIATGEIASKLRIKGFTVDEHIIYEQRPLALNDDALNAFNQGDIDILPLFSPMTARLLTDEIQQNPDWSTDQIHAVFLSKNVQKNTKGLAFRSSSTLETPSADAMTAEIAKYLRQ